ncbi:MAG: response regulator [Dehalococcoidales bacterium]|nr:response regulator [Dehalococcoidales bacterium]
MIKILIVSTDKEFIEDMEANLEMYQQDWQVSDMTSGKKCLENLNQNNGIDIVIVGKNLQDMPGLDLIKQIRDDSDVIIVLISQDKDISTLVKAYEVGADDYAVQPVNMFLFVTRLKALIRRNNWDKQARETKRFRNACYE